LHPLKTLKCRLHRQLGIRSSASQAATLCLHLTMFSRAQPSPAATAEVVNIIIIAPSKQQYKNHPPRYLRGFSLVANHLRSKCSRSVNSPNMNPQLSPHQQFPCYLETVVGQLNTIRQAGIPQTD
jgi:hypothetical protein